MPYRVFGLVETRCTENKEGRFTLVYLAAPQDKARSEAGHAPELELTITGTEKNTQAAVTSVIWPMRLMISMQPAKRWIRELS